MRTVVQIPVTSDLKDMAYNMAISQGFSSLQEAMRVIMHKFASGKLRVDVSSEPPAVQLSPAAIKRYNKMDEDFAAGKNFSKARSIEEMMQQLGYDPKY